jgi:GH43 family beta-xylosidase
MWAPNGYAVNEGPQILPSPGGQKLFLVYSACGSWDPCYSLGIMSIDVDKNPLDPAQWWVKDDVPVFTRSETTVGVGLSTLTEDAVCTLFRN